MFPDERTWQLSEAPFVPGKLHHSETIFALGNGYMGLRATFEEGYPDELASTLVHGVYNHAASELVPDLVNFPNPLPIMLSVDNETFNMGSGMVLGYRRMLDLQRAVLRREVLWNSPGGAIVQIAFERFASLELEHLLVQKVSVRALNRPTAIVLTAALDGTVTNQGVQHWTALKAKATGDHRIALNGETNQSHYGAAVAASVLAPSGATHVKARAGRAKQPEVQVEFTLRVDEQTEVVKLSALHTTRDTSDPLAAATATLDEAEPRGWESLLAGHVAEWAKYWHDSDIVIEGDEIAQRALRFAIYHILIAAPRHDDRVSIGAKTLSGPGYKGHVFWDTELFMVPLLTLTQPHLARNLLMYRYHNLAGARHKAAEAGFEGAMFPWESTDTGEETTPHWTNYGPDGTRIRIWTGDTEQHISTDIIYAVMNYWRWTCDDEFFARYGAELVLDTAVFWGSRVEYNADRDRFELTMQIGPDEYHENINNSVFTNTMVRWHLRTALQVYDWLHAHHPDQAETLLARLKITPERIARWQQIVDKMYIPYDAQRQIFEQFDGFFNLTPLELSYWQPRTQNMDYILGHDLTQKTMVIKQPDVVMLIALLGDEFGTPEAKRRNWDFYSRVVDHGSSLSPAIHALVAARLNLVREAYKLFIYATSIDLEDAKGNVRDGIHGAAAGGIWQAAIFGFAGLTLRDGHMEFDPVLPAHWNSVTFRIYQGGQQRTVKLTNQGE
ncbi:MAG TPA: glycosyl hydrolase family 65 protein [Aggregatilineales bacterium]|nr:glycosyl hydrolase family 65 protein [Aggregatilineales bacterium]